MSPELLQLFVIQVLQTPNSRSSHGDSFNGCYILFCGAVLKTMLNNEYTEKLLQGHTALGHGEVDMYPILPPPESCSVYFLAYSFMHTCTQGPRSYTQAAEKKNHIPAVCTLKLVQLYALNKH